MASLTVDCVRYLGSRLVLLWVDVCNGERVQEVGSVRMSRGDEVSVL